MKCCRNFSVLIFSFIFISSIAAQEIPNGIYLLAGAASHSFYPDRDSVFVTDVQAHKIALLQMPGPFFDEKDIDHAEYALAPVLNAKRDVWCFEFSLVKKGKVKQNELMERGAVLPFVFVFNEKAIAFGKLFQKDDWGFIHLGAMCNYNEIEVPFTTWSTQLKNNFDKQWNPLTCDSVYYYTNGKPAEDHFFRNGSRVEDREWYYNGNLKEIRFDSAGFMCRRQFNAAGKTNHFECRKGFSKREDWYEYRVYENGKTGYKDSCYSVNKISFEIKWYFDSTGMIVSKEFIRYLDYLPGEIDEGNDPMIISESEYKNGSLVAEKESFWASTMSGGENSGTWKYYENGKLVKTENYPDWKILYRKAGGKM